MTVIQSSHDFNRTKMKVVGSPRELPTTALRAWIVKNEDAARQVATEYREAWFYRTRSKKIAYLYVRNSEYEEKRKQP